MSRVPVLLTLLKELKEHINPHLKVLGIVCNRTFRSEPTAEEANRLSLLKDQCKDVWGEDVPQFKTLIPQSKEICLVEDERRPLAIKRGNVQRLCLVGRRSHRFPADLLHA